MGRNSEEDESFGEARHCCWLFVCRYVYSGLCKGVESGRRHSTATQQHSHKLRRWQLARRAVPRSLWTP